MQVRNVTRRMCTLCAPTREQLLEQRRADLGLGHDAPQPELALPLWQPPRGSEAVGELQ